VHSIEQGSLTEAMIDGIITWEDIWHISKHSDGHGRVFSAFITNVENTTLDAQAVDMVSYFRIDNLLVPIIDSHFVNCSGSYQRQMSLRTIWNINTEGKVRIVEYSASPMERATEHNRNGVSSFKTSNVGISSFDWDRLNLRGMEMNGHWLLSHIAKKRFQQMI
jgi:UDP-N-acetylglucosamine pyrophosphorylase